MLLFYVLRALSREISLAHRLYLAFELRDEASIRVSQHYGIHHQNAMEDRNEKSL